MTHGPYKRERFVRDRATALPFARGYFTRFPNSLYETEVVSVRALPSGKVEFIMQRLEWSKI